MSLQEQLKLAYVWHEESDAFNDGEATRTATHRISWFPNCLVIVSQEMATLYHPVLPCQLHVAVSDQNEEQAFKLIDILIDAKTIMNEWNKEIGKQLWETK